MPVNKTNTTLSKQTIAAIAARVANLRKKQRLSLDQLAARAGVSKGGVAGLEKGSGNPSIALLCQVAAALGVSVTDLLEMSSAREAEEYDMRGGKTLWRGPAGGSARLIFGTRGPQMFELWVWELFPGERYEAKAHAAGTQELLYPLSGTIGAAVGGERFLARSGRGLYLRTDSPHTYFCEGKRPSRFHMVVLETPEVKKGVRPVS